MRIYFPNIPEYSGEIDDANMTVGLRNKVREIYNNDQRSIIISNPETAYRLRAFYNIPYDPTRAETRVKIPVGSDYFYITCSAHSDDFMFIDYRCKKRGYSAYFR